VGKLNQVPDGLLSLLASKTDGVNPSELLESVRPAVDLLTFWTANDLNVETLSAAFAGLDSEVGVTVPDGELWLCHSCHITYREPLAAVAIALGLKFTGTLNQNDVSQDVFFAVLNERTTLVNSGVRLPFFFPRPFVLRAGQGIAGHLIDFGGAGTANGTMAVLKNSMLL